MELILDVLKNEQINRIYSVGMDSSLQLHLGSE